MTESKRTVIAALAAADVADAIRRMPGLRRAVSLAQRNRPDTDECPCTRCERERETTREQAQRPVD